MNISIFGIIIIVDTCRTTNKQPTNQLIWMDGEQEDEQRIYFMGKLEQKTSVSNGWRQFSIIFIFLSISNSNFCATILGSL